MWANFRNMVNHGQIKMLDPEYNEDARVMFNELVRLEKIVTAGNNIQIRHPKGEHDDLAMAVCMATNQAMNLNANSKSWVVEEHREPTPFELIIKQLQRQREESEYGEVW
jgi:hypothetical protein